MRHLLRPELIKLPLEAERKHEAISELIDVLVQYHEVPMAKRHGLVDDFKGNDWGIGQRLERGLAIPHVHTDRVDDFICAIGISPQGVNFGTLDDRPAKVVVLALAPKKGFGQEVQLLTEIERALEKDGLIEKLANVKSADEAYNLLGDVVVVA